MPCPLKINILCFSEYLLKDGIIQQIKVYLIRTYVFLTKFAFLPFKFNKSPTVYMFSRLRETHALWYLRIVSFVFIKPNICQITLVFQWCCSTPQGSPGVGRNTFLSSPHLCFIIVFICDLFVSRDDPLMS